MLLEVFTETEDESNALELILNYVEGNGTSSIVTKAKTAVKGVIKDTLGKKRIKAARDFIKG